jgi:pimeloyl-ACP methyl ester carboxylesterase
MIVECNGVEIAYDDEGAGDAVLFVHGHPFNRSMWSGQVEALRQSHRVINPDLRGYGDSSLTKSDVPTTLEAFSGDLASVLDALDVQRAVVVGLSMGGQIAMEFARSHPERTAGLVLAATFPHAETPEGVINRNRMADTLLEEGMARPGCEMLPKLVGKTSMKLRPSVASQVYQMIVSTHPAGAASALRGRALRRDYRDFLSTLTIPALIICGTEDAFTSVEEAREMHSRIQGSALEIFSNVGHMPNLEDPERFNDVLRAFLSNTRN